MPISLNCNVTTVNTLCSLTFNKYYVKSKVMNTKLFLIHLNSVCIYIYIFLTTTEQNG